MAGTGSSRVELPTADTGSAIVDDRLQLPDEDCRAWIVSEQLSEDGSPPINMYQSKPEKEADDEKTAIIDHSEAQETTPLIIKTPIINSQSTAYNSAHWQILLLSLSLSFGPTFWGSLQALGGAGRGEHTHTSAGLAVLYTCFMLSCLVVGTVSNRLRAPRAMLVIGGLGHVQYIAILWMVTSWESTIANGLGEDIRSGQAKSSEPLGFALLLISSAILGICKGPLWTTQGQLLMAYPDSSNRGASAGTFVMVQNVISVLGSLLPFIMNYWGGNGKGGVTQATYGVATAVISLSAILPLFMTPFTKVVRDDGSSPAWDETTEVSSIATEIRETMATFALPEMLLMTPLLWNHVNLPRFTVRTRALNNILSSVVGTATVKLFARPLDCSTVSARHRAHGAWKVTMISTVLFWVAVAVFGVVVRPKEDGLDEGKLDFASLDGWPGIAVYTASGIIDGISTVFLAAVRHVWGAIALAVGFGVSAAGIGEKWQWGWCSVWSVGALIPVYYLIERYFSNDNHTVVPRDEEVDV
ncbi:hypothetical protein HDU93_001976 [Gonapodya sp. JEL0774]|nr:hypothetical protein HDU93_001976 [Gonapodya sp. JEL0774]